MRIPIYLCFVFLLVLLSACRTTPSEQHQEIFGLWSIDSIKGALQAKKMPEQHRMIAYGSLGINYFVIGEFDSARLYLNRALSMPGGREYQGGRFMANLANSYGFQGRYVEALKYYMESLQWSEQMATTNTETGRHAGFNIIRTMANLAEIHYLTGNRKQALHYAEEARKKGDELGVLYITPQYLYIIGSVYLDQGKVDEAEIMMRQTFEVADTICLRCIRETGDALGMYMYVTYGQEGLARVALERKEYDRALDYAAAALEYAELHGDPTIKAKVLSVISDIYLAQDDYAESGRFAQKALDLFPDYARVNPGALFNVATGRLFAHDIEGAYEYFRLYSTVTKETTDKQFRETMAGLEVQYETEKKETRITSLEKQRGLYLLVGLVGIGFIIALWVLFRQKIRQERQEKQLVAANAISEWEKKERKRFAGELHDGINGMLSAAKLELNTTNQMQGVRDKLDDCIETIRRMARGMMPGSLERYGLKAALEDYCRLFPNAKFHFFGEDRREDEKLELMVYYCAYELVNNSFKHSRGRHIHVQLLQDNVSIALTVQDDGCGFDLQGVADGAGLKNIRDRVAAFDGKIDIVTAPGQGTETNIELNRKSN